MAQLQLTFCDAHKYKLDKDSFDGSISAIAELLIESHIVCDAAGSYALACAKTWASATSFAGSAYQGAVALFCHHERGLPLRELRAPQYIPA